MTEGKEIDFSPETPEGWKATERTFAYCGACGGKLHQVSTDEKFLYVNCNNCGNLVLRVELGENYGN